MFFFRRRWAYSCTRSTRNPSCSILRSVLQWNSSHTSDQVIILLSPTTLYSNMPCTKYHFGLRFSSHSTLSVKVTYDQLGNVVFVTIWLWNMFYFYFPPTCEWIIKGSWLSLAKLFTTQYWWHSHSLALSFPKIVKADILTTMIWLNKCWINVRTMKKPKEAYLALGK